MKIFNSLKTILWGNSIALAWTWGIGLFFTVQIAVQFGFEGLLTFASVNALGLALFGVFNHFIARKYQDAQDYERGFLERASNFKFGFLAYQFAAIALTLFAVMKYMTLPLGVLSIIVGVTILSAVIFLGDEFTIAKIKYSHLAIGLGVTVALYALWAGLDLGALITSISDKSANAQTLNGIIRLADTKQAAAYWIPIVIGFMFGPWLDLQHWQRAIQIHREELSLWQSYVVGGLIFWCIIMTNGLVTLTCFNRLGPIQASSATLPNISSSFNAGIADSSLLYQAKDTITQVLFQDSNLHSLLGFYIAFVILAALATFDSAYIALKWYLRNLTKDSHNIVLSVIPESLVTSPIPWFIIATITATTTMHFAEVGKFVTQFDSSLERFFMFELEYYLAFYATFFIIYDVCFIRAINDTKTVKVFSFLKLFSIGLCCTSIFGIGYFSENTFIMAIASLIPFVYGLYTLGKDSQQISKIAETASELLGKKKNLEITDQSAVVISQVAEYIPSSYALPEGAEAVTVPGCYIKDGWFVHSFIPTYQDTNSIGNIYFAMYSMWVGKTRELFFLHAMPDFDPKTSEFLILTRSYEHKFLREAKEFDKVTIQIRIADYNRKFVTMEHRILNEQGEALGKGKQSLMFVNSKDYSLSNIPDQVYTAFLPYATRSATTTQHTPQK